MIAAATVLAAVVATTFDTASRTAINPFNFFGYFTIQSNIILAVIYVISSLSANSARPRLELARACATSYIVVVGVVYALLLAPLGAAGGVPLPWANAVLHIIIPVYAVIDWLFVGDRSAVAFRLLWVSLVYPLLWCGVVLVRGAIDGWVPYPFLDPANGYPSVILYVVIIAITVLAVASLTFWASRWRGILR